MIVFGLLILLLSFFYIFSPLDKSDDLFNARHDLLMLKDKIEQFHEVCGEYPSNEIGLEALVKSKEPPCFKGKAIEYIPRDNIKGYDYQNNGDSFLLKIVE